MMWKQLLDQYQRYELFFFGYLAVGLDVILFGNSKGSTGVKADVRRQEYILDGSPSIQQLGGGWLVYRLD